MSINTEKLLTQLRHLTIHPEKHDQSQWAKLVVENGDTTVKPLPSACGSFGCLAGNTVLADGHELYWESAFIGDEGKAIWSADYLNEDGERGRFIMSAAKDILGLTEDQAEALFSSGNSRDDLWAYAIEFTEGEIGLGSYLTALRDAKAAEVEAERLAEAKAEEAKAEALLAKFRVAYPVLYRSIDEAQTKAEEAKTAYERLLASYLPRGW
jgi:hypothetical protein